MSWTYTTLKSAIQDYTQNTESTFVADLATIITQAEQRIIKSVELPNFRKNVTGSLTSGNQYLSAPSDYLYPYSLAVLDSDSNYSYLLNTDVSFIREAYPVAATTGTPKHYAQFDDDQSVITYTKVISDLNLEKNKKDYTPRSVGSAYNILTGEGLSNQYIVWGEPENVKKLQRGNFNVVIGESEIDGLTPDGTFTSHTQMAYSNSSWDLQVSVNGGASWSAFESEVLYTFGADANENFSDTNAIWFHSDVLISDYDDTTITNCNNLYMGDMLFRWAPSELAWNAAKKDFYYKIKDNFEDKI
jgi:hypothetical protein